MASGIMLSEQDTYVFSGGAIWAYEKVHGVDGKWVVEVNWYVSSLSLKRVRDHEAKITRIQSNVIQIMVWLGVGKILSLPRPSIKVDALPEIK